jgi:hypothetical protein
VEEQPAAGSGGVDRLVEYDQVDVAGGELAGELDQVAHRAADAVELGDDQLVAGAQVVQGAVELGAAGESAAAPWSTKTRAQPARWSASSWAWGCWSRVETRA